MIHNTKNKETIYFTASFHSLTDDLEKSNLGSVILSILSEVLLANTAVFFPKSERNGQGALKFQSMSFFD